MIDLKAPSSPSSIDTAAGFLPPSNALPNHPWNDPEVIELPLLITRAQAIALEALAAARGVTCAQMLRSLIGATLAASGTNS